MERRDDGKAHTLRARELRRVSTAWERILWRGLKKTPYRWRQQHPLAGFYLDLYCDAARLAVEADGAMHDPGYDAFRDAKLAEEGVRTLRFTNVEIGADPKECLRKIVEVMEERVTMFARQSDGS